MEQFRKIVANVRSSVWNRLEQHPWLNDPKGDVFRSFGIILVLAGINFEHANPWQRICWYGYNLLGYCTLTIMVLCSVENWIYGIDIVAGIWYTVISLALLIGLVQHLILRLHWKSIRCSTKFINLKLTLSSKDTTIDDSTVRGIVFRKTQLMSYGLLIAVVVSVLVAPYWIYQNDRFLRFPRMFQTSLDGWFPKVVYFSFIWPIWPFWALKKLGPTIIATALLAGFEAEMRVLVRKFKFHQKLEERSSQQLNNHVRMYVEQHIQLMEHLQKLRPVITKLFLVVYYNTLLVTACFTYILVIEQLSAGTLFYSVLITIYALECYWWSTLAESFYDVCTSFEESICDLLGELVHGSERRHADTIRLQKDLMIVKSNVRRSAQFNCAGLYTISLETFGHLWRTMFSFLAFLLKVASPKAV